MASIVPFAEEKWAYAMTAALRMLMTPINRAMDQLSAEDKGESKVTYRDTRVFNGKFKIDTNSPAPFIRLAVLLFGGPLFGGKIHVGPSSLLKKLSQHVNMSGYELYDTTDKERMNDDHTFCLTIARPEEKISGVKLVFSTDDADRVSAPIKTARPVAANAPTKPIGDVPVSKRQSTKGLPGLSIVASATVSPPVMDPPTEDEWKTVGCTATDSPPPGSTLNRKQRRAALFIAKAKQAVEVQATEPAVEVRTTETVEEVQTTETVEEVQTTETVKEVRTTVTCSQVITMTIEDLSAIITAAVSTTLGRLSSK